MSIVGTIVNGSVKLPAGCLLPEGTAVRIEWDSAQDHDQWRLEQWLKWAVGASQVEETTDEILAMTRSEW